MVLFLGSVDRVRMRGQKRQRGERQRDCEDKNPRTEHGQQRCGGRAETQDTRMPS